MIYFIVLGEPFRSAIRFVVQRGKKIHRIPDRELIRRSVSGDGKAFATLVECIETPLMRLVRSEITDSTYAEDVLRPERFDQSPRANSFIQPAFGVAQNIG